MANALLSVKKDDPNESAVDPLFKELVKVKYIGNLTKGATQIYGVQMVPGQIYEFPFAIAEVCAREETLFQVVDDTPAAVKLKEMAKKAIGKG